MYLADEIVPKRENGPAANRRLTRYIMLASLFHLSSYITQRTQCMSMPVQCVVYSHVRAIIPCLRPVSKLPEHTHTP